MKRSVWCLVLSVLLAGGVALASERAAALAVDTGAEAGAASLPDPAKGSGYELLDQLGNLFMVPYGSAAEMTGRLNELMRKARTAYEQKAIPLPFLTRFQRILSLFRLITLEDPEGLMKATMQAQVDEFVRETIGAEPGSGGKLPHVARAVEEEVVNLKFYLDTLPQRQQLLDKLREKLPPPKPAAK